MKSAKTILIIIVVIVVLLYFGSAFLMGIQGGHV
jgi:hypothetical protein